MKLAKNIITVTTLILGLALNVQAQSIPDAGSLGLRANIATAQSFIEVPYMLNESLSIAPYLGFTLIGDSDDNTPNGSKAFNFGVMPRYYLGQSNAISTYATGNVGLSIFSPNGPNTNSNVNFNIGVGYGAEYFLSDQFSVSGDANIGLRAGDAQTRFNTVVRLSASFYF